MDPNDYNSNEFISNNNETVEESKENTSFRHADSKEPIFSDDIHMHTDYSIGVNSEDFTAPLNDNSHHHDSHDPHDPHDPHDDTSHHHHHHDHSLDDQPEDHHHHHHHPQHEYDHPMHNEYGTEESGGHDTHFDLHSPHHHPSSITQDVGDDMVSSSSRTNMVTDEHAGPESSMDVLTNTNINTSTPNTTSVTTTDPHMMMSNFSDHNNNNDDTFSPTGEVSAPTSALRSSPQPTTTTTTAETTTTKTTTIPTATTNMDINDDFSNQRDMGNLYTTPDDYNTRNYSNDITDPMDVQMTDQSNITPMEQEPNRENNNNTNPIIAAVAPESAMEPMTVTSGAYGNINPANESNRNNQGQVFQGKNIEKKELVQETPQNKSAEMTEDPTKSKLIIEEQNKSKGKSKAKRKNTGGKGSSQDLADTEEMESDYVVTGPNKKSISPGSMTDRYKEELQHCDRILQSLITNPQAIEYRTPVDWKALGLETYISVVKRPMDLGTINEKMKKGKYKNADMFAKDVRQVWKNSLAFNTPGSPLYCVADNLSKQFEKKFARVLKYETKVHVDYLNTSQGNCQERWTQLVNAMYELNAVDLGRFINIIEMKCPYVLNDFACAEENKDDRTGECLDIEIAYIPPPVYAELLEFCQICINKYNNKNTNEDNKAINDVPMTNVSETQPTITEREEDRAKEIKNDNNNNTENISTPATTVINTAPNTNPDPNPNINLNTNPNTNPEPSSNPDPDPDPDPYPNSNSNSNPNPNNSNPDSNSNSNSNPDPNPDPNTNLNSNIDTNIDMNTDITDTANNNDNINTNMNATDNENDNYVYKEKNEPEFEKTSFENVHPQDVEMRDINSVNTPVETKPDQHDSVMNEMAVD